MSTPKSQKSNLDRDGRVEALKRIQLGNTTAKSGAGIAKVHFIRLAEFENHRQGQDFAERLTMHDITFKKRDLRTKMQFDVIANDREKAFELLRSFQAGLPSYPNRRQTRLTRDYDRIYLWIPIIAISTFLAVMISRINSERGWQYNYFFGVGSLVSGGSLAAIHEWSHRIQRKYGRLNLSIFGLLVLTAAVGLNLALWRWICQ